MRGRKDTGGSGIQNTPVRREILQLYVFYAAADVTHCSNLEQGSLFLFQSLFNCDTKSEKKEKKLKQ